MLSRIEEVGVVTHTNLSAIYRGIGAGDEVVEGKDGYFGCDQGVIAINNGVNMDMKVLCKEGLATRSGQALLKLASRGGIGIRKQIHY